MNTAYDNRHNDNDNHNHNHNHSDNDNHNDNQDNIEIHHDNIEIKAIVIPESMLGTEYLNANNHEFNHDNVAVDKINDGTSAQWKLDLNELDWLSIKERGNELYKLEKEYEKARFAYVLASRKCSDDKNKAICLGNLSAVYFEQKDYKAVIKACDECLELNPGIYIFYYKLLINI